MAVQSSQRITILVELLIALAGTVAAHVVTSSMTKITGELGWKLAVFKLLPSKPVISSAIQ